MLLSYIIFYFLSVAVLYTGALWYDKEGIRDYYRPGELKGWYFAFSSLAALIFPLTVPLACIFVFANKVIKL